MSLDAEALSLVVESIYDCSIDPALWPQALAEVAHYLDGKNARIFLFNNDAKRDGLGRSLGIDPDFDAIFANDIETLTSIKYGFIVSHLDVGVTLAEYLGLHGGRDVNGAEYFENRLYKDYMVPRGYHDTMAALMIKNARRFGGLAMTRQNHLPLFGPEEKEKVRLLGPHIRRAWAIAEMVEQKTIERNRFAEVIDRLATPVAMVEPNGRVLHLNPAANELVARGDALRADNNILRAVHAESRLALADLLQSGEARHARSTSIRRTSTADLIASVLPLRNSARTHMMKPVPAGPSAIFFHEPDRPPQFPGEALAKLYKLTGAELRILLALAQGATLQDISNRGGAKLTTVRSHLKSVFSKTGKSRQAELVQMTIMAISPLRTEEGAR